MSFRERLRDEIEYKGFSVKEFAASLGISNSTFLSYIDARGVLPNVETAVKIAEGLGVTVEYLVTGKSSNETKNNHKSSIIKHISENLELCSEHDLEAIFLLVKKLAEK